MHFFVAIASGQGVQIQHNIHLIIRVMFIQNMSYHVKTAWVMHREGTTCTHERIGLYREAFSGKTLIASYVPIEGFLYA